MRFLKGNAKSDKISLQSLFMGALVLFGLLALICVWPAKIPEFHKDFGGLENPAFYFDTGDESPYSKEFTAVLPYVDTLDFYTKNAQPVLVHVRL
ncbi:MAG: hypothetical protein IJU50_01800, partial [Lachnospiraceae bacterium]|nr:hypothetical protein [Lachnospiraceae bacterium]